MADPLDDFRNVLCLVWRQILGRDPTPVQYEIAHWLQHGPRRQVTEAFRGVGKSWITSTYAVDVLRKDQSKNVLVVSASKERADAFSTFALRLINEVPIFQHLAPRDGQRNSKIAFDVRDAPAAHAPSMKSVGITGQLTGSRADELIADDVETPKNSDTQNSRDKLGELVKEFDSIIKPGGSIKYLGTPQTEQTLYNELPGRGYLIRVWPAKYPTPDEVSSYGDRLAPGVAQRLSDNPKLVGHSTDPDRFSDLDLLEREASYGRSGFSLQFQLDARLSDADRYPLKLSDLCIMDLDTELGPEKVVWARSPELELKTLPCVGFQGDRFYRPMSLPGKLIPYTASLMAIDPAGRGKDETACCVLKMLNGQLFLLDMLALRGGSTEANLERIARTCAMHKLNKVVVEANFGDGMFSQLLKPYLTRIHPCSIEEVKHSTQKERRIIETLEPVMNQHKLIVATRVVEQDGKLAVGEASDRSLHYQLFHQMTRITKERGALAQDDRIDVVAMGVSHFVERMGLDVDQAVKDRKSLLEAEELKRFMDHVIGGRPKPAQTWLSNGLRARRR